MSTLRESIEKASLPLLTRITTLPRVVPFLVVLLVMIGGIVLPSPGWLLFGVAAAFLLWLLYLGWPSLRTPERLMRVAVIGLVLAVMVTQASPRG